MLTLRIRVVAFAAAIAAPCAACAPTEAPESEAELEARARAVHAAALTIDTHDDIPFDFATPEVDPLNADRQVNLEKMRAGGLDVGFFIVYVGQGARTRDGYREAAEGAVTKFEAIHRMAEQMYPDQIEIAYRADDVERIHATGKLVAAIGIENGYVIGRDISLLADYFDRGARYMTLAHNGHNDIADSAQPRSQLGDALEEHDGLSAFGEQVVAEMNRLGIMVDISHISKDAALDAIRASRAPVIASHSATVGVQPHPRNLDDEALLALRDNGGVVQVVAYPAYVKATPPEKAEELAELRYMRGFPGTFGPDSLETMSSQDKFEYEMGIRALEVKYPPPSVVDLVNHIDYAVKLIGIDHVGISSDFDGGGGVLHWDDASETPNVTLELVRRGYSEEDIAKLWGGNLLRVWREVERVAGETTPAPPPAR
ncbi:MAG: membrane dipeptidase [Gemmatimonadetes bacterium]|nr:membrane dipeptidase [Gemmatimonadota bacterium]